MKERDPARTLIDRMRFEELQEYIKTEDFIKLIELEQEQNPYECVLSFDKYIKSINSKYDETCKFSKGIVPFLKDVENKMTSQKDNLCSQLKSEAT